MWRLSEDVTHIDAGLKLLLLFRRVIELVTYKLWISEQKIINVIDGSWHEALALS